MIDLKLWPLLALVRDVMLLKLTTPEPLWCCSPCAAARTRAGADAKACSPRAA